MSVYHCYYSAIYVHPAQFTYTPCEEKNHHLAFFFFFLQYTKLWHSSSSFFFFFFFLQQTYRNSVVSSYARLHINSLHFLVHSAVCSQMSCTSCLSNNDIQTPDQISVPCTTPYFHKDMLTPPSSSRSPPLEGGGSRTYASPQCVSI